MKKRIKNNFISVVVLRFGFLYFYFLSMEGKKKFETNYILFPGNKMSKGTTWLMYIYVYSFRMLRGCCEIQLTCSVRMSCAVTDTRRAEI
jgi:hypothetical protein